MNKHESVTIGLDDFYYDDGDGEPPMFCEDVALAWLIMQDGPVVLLNAKDHEGKDTIGIYVNCSDVFAWGCADCEPLPMSELERFLKLYLTHPAGDTKWCCLRRNEQPQPPVKRNMIARGAWDDALEALPKNTEEALRQMGWSKRTCVDVDALNRQLREHKARLAEGQVVIEVRRRSDDYHAQLKGQPENWGCGRTLDEAVGALVRAHPELCGVVVE